MSMTGHTSGTTTILRITLRECLGSTGMLLTMALVVVTGIAVSLSAPWWLDGSGAMLVAVMAPLVSTLVVLMSFVTGPLSRDLANGTTVTLIASAVTAPQIVAGTAAALATLALPPALLTTLGVFATTGTWTETSVALWITTLVFSPVTAIALSTVSVAVALWKGTDAALIAPWGVTMVVGAALVLLVALGDTEPTSWGTAAVIAVAALSVTLAAIAALAQTARELSR